MTGQSLTSATTSRRSGIGKALVAIVFGYALALLLKNDSVFFLGLLGVFVMAGGYIALSLATYPKASGRGASDVHRPDPHAAVKAHYTAILCWFAAQAAVAAAGLAAAAVLGTTYLFPLMPLSIVAAVMGLAWTSTGMYWTWKCARAVRAFQPVVRPFVPLNLSGSGKRSLRLGDVGSGASPIMAGMDPLLHNRWPAGGEDWAWFAGDDAFGGVVMLPHSGMLIFAQPKEWQKTGPDREAAGPERTEQARQAALLKRAKKL
ncbi:MULTISPECIES: hypothetical protein [unclassified Streptomyces]|uniref:hypothetical protein n=1 Tax=unclassified Streptomyces TaxID=2593676 RepID=UPI000DB938E6|nr:MULTISPECIES: hypothetical protein [unclassified Streptomyces]MYT73316.1 hypothetical protein [Streptomyces sp. SID8367]RAJ74916.1 hypothetical protein K377_06683 [Streptomyces sp. PsTaAH-137]